ncbi:MAG: serine/threonine-protein phosphatase [Rhodobacteraceae bacterium]|nr:serine/threonine-protein phosphatase [Paracoccaceae bacterium]
MSATRYSAITHVGKVRTVNEDSILSLPDQQIWVVSDGMGGHEGGDFASQTVVEAVAALPPDQAPGDMMRSVRAAVLKAHDAIRSETERRGAKVVGATVVALMMANNHFAAFWAGDSRLYRFRDGEIEMLTFDHSMVAEFVADGTMDWDEAEHHPQSNAITRAVGVGEELELDKVRGETRSGDRFLLCSDGLTKYASFETLRRTVVGEPIETVCSKLLDLALIGGGADNISIIVVDVI